MPSRLDDATQKIMWGDGHWAALQGGGAVVELLYTDEEGRQREIGMFPIARLGEERWVCSMVRHWNLDRPDPR